MISKVKKAVEHWPDWLLLLVSIFLLSVVSFFALTFWELRTAAQNQTWGGNIISTLSHLIQIVGCCVIGFYVGKRRAARRSLSTPLVVGAVAVAAVLLFYLTSWRTQVVLNDYILPSGTILYNASLMQQFLIEKGLEPPNALALIGCEIFYLAPSVTAFVKKVRTLLSEQEKAV